MTMTELYKTFISGTSGSYVRAAWNRSKICIEPQVCHPCYITLMWMKIKLLLYVAF